MPSLRISDVTVEFPFEPYECQKAYMEAVMRSLQQEQNAILESPTGTGKTLCLLCASLAWLETVKARFQGEQVIRGDLPLSTYAEQLNAWLAAGAGAASSRGGGGLLPLTPPKIIYASRTHSQLSQVMDELKRTAYRSMKTAVVGSRDQLCINPTVMNELSNAAKVNACRAKVLTRTCTYYNNVETKKSASDFTKAADDGSRVLDIEDLNKLGNKHRCCPYYLARSMAKDSADIIFMPYNYLLDPAARKNNGIELNGNVVIFDEAHNLESLCEESASFDLTAGHLGTAIGEVGAVLTYLVEEAKSEMELPDSFADENSKPSEGLQIDGVARVKAMLIHLEQEIDKLELKGGQLVAEGKFMFEFLERVNLTFATYEAVLKVLEDIVLFLSTEGGASLSSTKGAGISEVAGLIKIVFYGAPREGQTAASYQASLSQFYKVFVKDNTKEKASASTWGKPQKDDGRTLSYWCFSPGYAMQDLLKQGVKCVILTSGTLRPLSSFSAQMRIPFPIKLENPHVISKEQILLEVVTKGPDGVALNSSFNTRSNSGYQMSLGNAIVNFARLVPSGLLIFFPSYSFKQTCVDTWKREGLLDRIQQIKPVILEPKNKKEFKVAMDEFYAAVNGATANGAIFIGVCRGKVSEGLDFADTNGRGVIITGLPYSSRVEPRIVLKMQYLDERCRMERNSSVKLLSGSEWYQQDMSRAVNQAVGRVIRHKNDYGAILLCDSRFANPGQIEQLPTWLKQGVRKCDSFGQVVRDLTTFFKTADAKYPCAHKVSVQGVGTSKHQSATARCVDAMFEPDATSRLVAVPATVNSSSSAASGLRARTSNAAGCISLMYLGAGGVSGNERAAENKRGSLLDALSQADTAHEKKASHRSYFDTPEPKLSELSQTQSTQPSAKKKRIAIKDQKVPAAKFVDMSRNVVSEIRGQLSLEGSRRFDAATRTYCMSKNLSALMNVLSELFLARAELHDLFLSYRPYILPEHREQFDDQCLRLVGRKYMPPSLHAASDKRSATQNGLHVQTSNFNSPSVSGRRATPSQSSTAGHTGTRGSLLQFFGTDRCAGEQYCKVPTTATATSATAAVGGGGQLGRPEAVGRSGAPSPDLLSEPSSRSPVVIVSDDDDDDERNDSALASPPCRLTHPQPADALSDDSQPSQLGDCPLCSLTLVNPLTALCGHSCCIRCWIARLKVEMTCPECGASVMKRDLVASTAAG